MNMPDTIDSSNRPSVKPEQIRGATNRATVTGNGAEAGDGGRLYGKDTIGR